MKNLLSILLIFLLWAPQVTAFTFTEDFSGSSINSFWWKVDTLNGDTIVLDTNSQSLKMYQNTTSGSVGLTLNHQLTGDFEITVDYKTYNWDMTGHDQQRVGLGCGDLSVQRVSDFWFGGEVYLIYWAGESWHNGTDTTDTSGKLRVKRVGSTITGYFWNYNLNGGAGDWEVAYYSGTLPSRPDPIKCYLSIWSGYTGTQIGNIIEWDNFVLNAPDTPNPLETNHIYLPLLLKSGT